MFKKFINKNIQNYDYFLNMPWKDIIFHKDFKKLKSLLDSKDY